MGWNKGRIGRKDNGSKSHSRLRGPRAGQPAHSGLQATAGNIPCFQASMTHGSCLETLVLVEFHNGYPHLPYFIPNNRRYNIYGKQA